MNKNTCEECGLGTYREITTTHLIKTRDERRQKINIENLPINECNICGYIELPEKSEDIIQNIKLVIQKEMERSIEEEQAITKQAYESNAFTNIFKRRIN